MNARRTVETVIDLRRCLDQEEERRDLRRQTAASIQPAPQAGQEGPREAPPALEPSEVLKGFLARLLGL